MKVEVASFIFLNFFALSNGRFTSPLQVANGTVEEPHTSPWQVKLFLGHSVMFFWPCGGTLISNNYILTAARCFSYLNIQKTHGMYIYLGFQDVLNPKDPGSLILETNVDYVTYHEGYNDTTHENDIALIKLPSPVEFTDQIQAAKLLSEDKVELGQVGHISGWQFPYEERDPDHSYLHGGDVTVVDNSVCQDEYPSYVINDNEICAAGTVSMCYGDEGAPLIIDGKVAAIAYGSKPVSNPEEKCPILPNTYHYIPKYLDWIKANSDYTD